MERSEGDSWEALSGEVDDETRLWMELQAKSMAFVDSGDPWSDSLSSDLRDEGSRPSGDSYHK